MNRPPTIIDVADAAGVSKATVSRVLRGEDRVSLHARKVVLKAVDEIGYRPNLVARSLKERVVSVVGYVASDLSNPYYADILHGIYAAAGVVGHQIIIASGHEEAGGEEGAIRTLRDFRVAGIILASPAIRLRRIARMTDGIPVVIEGHANAPSNFDIVTSDDVKGACLIIDHLFDLGHRSFALLEDASLAGQDRVEGFATALKIKGLTSSARRTPSHTSAEGGYDSMRALLRRGSPPTAVVCDNDVMAAGAMSAAEELGLHVPDDISITGFDDIALAGLRQLNLTTVSQDRWSIGQIAFEVLHRRIQDPDSHIPHRVILEPTLHVRGSTGPAPRR